MKILMLHQINSLIVIKGSHEGIQRTGLRSSIHHSHVRILIRFAIVLLEVDLLLIASHIVVLVRLVTTTLRGLHEGYINWKFMDLMRYHEFVIPT